MSFLPSSRLRGPAGVQAGSKRAVSRQSAHWPTLFFIVSILGRGNIETWTCQETQPILTATGTVAELAGEDACATCTKRLGLGCLFVAALMRRMMPALRTAEAARPRPW